MGTEVHFKSYSPVCYSMSDRNKNGDSGSWPRRYEDKTLIAENFYEPFLQMQTTDGYSESEREALKQAMLKHEVIFRNQVYELHRLYGVQKDFMDKLKRNELHQHQEPVEAFQSSQISSEDVQKPWSYSQNQFSGSTCHASTSHFNNLQSPLNFNKESSMLIDHTPTHSNRSSMNYQLQQPTLKNGSVRLDLQLPADEYLASEDSYPSKKYCRVASENDTNNSNPSCQGDASSSKHDFADLNREFCVEEATTAAPVDVTDRASSNRETQEKNFFSKPNSVFVGLSLEYLHNSRRGRDDRMHIDIQHVENKDGWHGLDVHAHQSDSCSPSLPASSGINPKRIPSIGSEGKVFQEDGICLELQSESNSSQNRSSITGLDYNGGESRVASGCITNDNNGANSVDMKSTKGMDLNLAPSCGLEVGSTPQQDSVLPKLGMIFGFPIVNKVPGLKDLPSEVPDVQECAKRGKLHTGLACMNHTISNSSAKEENVLRKARTHEMDLEAPVMVDTDALEDVATVEDSSRNELEKRFQWKRTPRKLVKAVAESVANISTTKSHCSENATWLSMEPSVRDPLRWFAEVATSVTADLKSKRCVDDDILSCGMDYFESMTLKLTETKVDEYYPKSSVPDHPKEVTGVSSLMNKHCRGKGRRGGQQRNFQRDILPGFASLAKHEVSEDLEMLKGLMRSMGHSWQIGAARKNAAKNARTKGRRSPRGSNLLLA